MSAKQKETTVNIYSRDNIMEYKARYNLWRDILEAGDSYIYSDTDSIKTTNYEENKERRLK